MKSTQLPSGVARSRVIRACLAAIAFICLHGVSAHAQNPIQRDVILHCNQNEQRYDPSLPDSPSVIDVPSSDNPAVATGVRQRIGGGTAGQIEISGHGSGEATITYHVQGFSDSRTFTVNLHVTVYCPNFPAIPSAPTHVVARCDACKRLADKVNQAVDAVAAAIDTLQSDEKALHEAYDNFSKKTPTSDDSSLDAMRALQDKVNADLANIARLQTQVTALARALNACENGCNPAAGQPQNGRQGGDSSPIINNVNVSHALPSHRTTNCDPCKVTASELNDAIDRLQKAILTLEDLERDDHVDSDVLNEAKQQVNELRQQVTDISRELDACEKKCSVPQTTGANPVPLTSDGPQGGRMYTVAPSFTNGAPATPTSSSTVKPAAPVTNRVTTTQSSTQTTVTAPTGTTAPTSELTGSAPVVHAPATTALPSTNLPSTVPAPMTSAVPLRTTVPSSNLAVFGQNVRPGDYATMDQIVHQTLGTQWRAVSRAQNGSVIYQSPTGQYRTASFASGQIAIQ